MKTYILKLIVTYANFLVFNVLSRSPGNWSNNIDDTNFSKNQTLSSMSIQPGERYYSTISPPTINNSTPSISNEKLSNEKLALIFGGSFFGVLVIIAISIAVICPHRCCQPLQTLFQIIQAFQGGIVGNDLLQSFNRFFRNEALYLQNGPILVDHLHENINQQQETADEFVQQLKELDDVAQTLEEPQSVDQQPEEPQDVDQMLEEPQDVDQMLEEPQNVDQPPEEPQDVDQPPEEPQDVEQMLEEPQDVGQMLEEPQDVDQMLEEPQNVDQPPEEPQDVDQPPEEPQDVEQMLEEPQNVDQPLEEPQDVEQMPEEPQDVDQPPEEPQDVDQPPEEPQDVDQPPEEPQDVDQPPEEPQDVDQPPEEPQDVDQPPEEPQDVEQMLGDPQDVDQPPEEPPNVLYPYHNGYILEQNVNNNPLALEDNEFMIQEDDENINLFDLEVEYIPFDENGNIQQQLHFGEVAEQGDQLQPIIDMLQNAGIPLQNAFADVPQFFMPPPIDPIPEMQPNEVPEEMEVNGEVDSDFLD